MSSGMKTPTQGFTVMFYKLSRYSDFKRNLLLMKGDSFGNLKCGFFFINDEEYYWKFFDYIAAENGFNSDFKFYQAANFEDPFSSLPNGVLEKFKYQYPELFLGVV